MQRNGIGKSCLLFTITLLCALPIVFASHLHQEGISSAQRIIGDYTSPAMPQQGRYYYAPSDVFRIGSAFIADGGTQSRITPATGQASGLVPRVAVRDGRLRVGRPVMSSVQAAARGARLAVTEGEAGDLGTRQSAMNIPLEDLARRHLRAEKTYGSDLPIEEVPRTARRIIGSYTKDIVRRGRYYYTAQARLDEISPIFIGPAVERKEMTERRFSVGSYATQYRKTVGHRG